MGVKCNHNLCQWLLSTFLCAKTHNEDQKPKSVKWNVISGCLTKIKLAWLNFYLNRTLTIWYSIGEKGNDRTIVCHSWVQGKLNWNARITKFCFVIRFIPYKQSTKPIKCNFKISYPQDNGFKTKGAYLFFLTEYRFSAISTLKTTKQDI